MRIRDSGMPDQQMWEGFFDPSRVLRQLGFLSRTDDVADLGCGAMAPFRYLPGTALGEHNGQNVQEIA
jgi:hypothetical protein